MKIHHRDPKGHFLARKRVVWRIDRENRSTVALWYSVCDVKKPPFGARSLALSLYKPIYYQFCAKNSQFSLPRQHGSGCESLTSTRKLVDPLNSITGGRILVKSPMQTELWPLLRWNSQSLSWQQGVDLCKLWLSPSSRPTPITLLDASFWVICLM